MENTHLEEDELFDLRRSLATIAGMVKILNHSDEDEAHAEQEDGWRREKKYPYPALHRLSKDVMTFPQLIQRIDQILDKFGKIRDNATPNSSRFDENWRKPKEAFHAPSTAYCELPRARAWWRKT